LEEGRGYQREIWSEGGKRREKEKERDSLQLTSHWKEGGRVHLTRRSNQSRKELVGPAPERREEGAVSLRSQDEKGGRKEKEWFLHRSGKVSEGEKKGGGRKKFFLHLYLFYKGRREGKTCCSLVWRGRG